MDPYEPFQPEITAICETLGANNPPLNPQQKQTREFLTKNAPLQRTLRTHRACTMALTAWLRYLVCTLGPTHPNKLLQPEITVT